MHAQWGLEQFGQIAGRCVLKFAPGEVLIWLKSPAFKRLATPSASDVVSAFLRPGASAEPPDLSPYLELLDHLRASLGAEGVADSLKKLLRSSCSLDTARCCELVAQLSMPLIAEPAHMEIAIQILKGCPASAFPGAGMDDQQIAFLLSVLRGHHQKRRDERLCIERC